ncbi:MAG: phosphatase PAP2 family protein [Candidatus Cloacimonetes bacterium]|nr:phosphatase PAP2 family protein [Candidatus Cloacimonadota bacterium]MCF7868665.1 phosphatase PAP2 family protein [Candidatus Cloacimonadota bacterium]
MKYKILILLLVLFSLHLSSQVFKVDRQKFLLASSTALAADLLNNYVDRKIIEKPTIDELSKLDEKDIPFFDSWALQSYSTKLKDLSDYTAYLTIGLTAFYAYDDYDWLNNLMVFSQIMITQSAVAKWTKTLSHRYRPFVYDDEVSIEKKQERNSQHSLYSMHSSTVFAASTFAYFYYSKFHGKSISTALILYTPSVATAILRVTSANHFVSDVVFGAIVGTGISYFICNSYLSDSFHVEVGYNSIGLKYKF